MTDQELGRMIKESRPEVPLGFDTRVEARLSSLTRKEGFHMKKMRTALVLAVLAVLMMVGTVGVASRKNDGATTIPARLNREPGPMEEVVYRDNTVGLAGLCLRDVYPGLTDKWYNVVPVDLTVQGRQTFQLIASNMYYIGECYVDVSGDDVTVTYATYKGRLNRLSECLMWFAEPDEITGEYLDAPISGYGFGEKVSISQTLKGAKTALLFVCNHVTYKNPYNERGASLVRYWPNIPEWKEFRAGLMPLMDRAAEEAAQRREEARAAAEAEARAAAEAEATAELEAQPAAETEIQPAAETAAPGAR